MRFTKRVLASLVLSAGLLAGGPAASPLPSGGELQAEEEAASKLMYFRILYSDICYSACAKGAYCCQKVYLPK